MSRTESFRLNLMLPESSMVVHMIKLLAFLPDSLTFQRTISIDDYPFTRLLNSSPNEYLAAILIEPLDTGTTTPFLQYVESLFTPPYYKMIELLDPADLQFIYILVHALDSSGLGGYIKSSKIGLFKFNLFELLEGDLKKLIECSCSSKSLKSSLFQLYLTTKLQINDIEAENARYLELYRNLEKKKQEAQNEFEEAKAAANQLSFQLGNQRHRFGQMSNQDLECVLCRHALRNTIILTCGHIVACKECVSTQMNIVINRKLPRNSQLTCPMCKGPVREIKEIFY